MTQTTTNNTDNINLRLEEIQSLEPMKNHKVVRKFTEFKIDKDAELLYPWDARKCPEEHAEIHPNLTRVDEFEEFKIFNDINDVNPKQTTNHFEVFEESIRQSLLDNVCVPIKYFGTPGIQYKNNHIIITENSGL